MRSPAAAAARSPTSAQCGSASRRRSVGCSETQAMPQPSPVADYLDALTRALAFDPALARRVRREAADHLGEVVERDGGERITTEARAVAAFGDAHMLARRFAAASLMA